MKKSRLSLEKFGKQTIRTSMMSMVNGGRESVSGGKDVSSLQDDCHPDPVCTDGSCSQ